MSSKTNIVLDKILKGVLINKHNEINYIATIVVELEKDIQFEYAIVDEGYEDNDLTFTQVKKTLVVTHRNTDDVFKKKLLMLKSSEKVNANISIELEKFYNNDLYHETINSTGKVLLGVEDPAAQPSTGGVTQPGEVTPKTTTKVWYKDPWIIGAIIVGILVLTIMMSYRKKNTNSLFLE